MMSCFISATPFLLIFWLGFYDVRASDFNPYVMNGGLLAAVAGRDFMVVATDTRLAGPTGYDILDRCHIASRLWAVTPLNPTQSSLSIGQMQDAHKSMFAPDGSLNVALLDEMLQSKDISSDKSPSSLRLLHESQHTHLPPVVVGSVGCQADCEHLKRSMRADIRAAIHFGEVSKDYLVESMAVTLSQILYSRRGFPFGSYCILGGLSVDAGGQVFVYDAIGSYEKVAISCTGTGFELLQPILDRKFAPFKTGVDDATAIATKADNLIQRPPTQVSCTAVEDAVRIVLAAYRSVAEREIGVGDYVVFYTVQKLKDVYQSKIWIAALKKH